MNSPPAGGGVPASPHPMPFPHAREGNLEPPLSSRERGGGEGFAGGGVGGGGKPKTPPVYRAWEARFESFRIPPARPNSLHRVGRSPARTHGPRNPGSPLKRRGRSFCLTLYTNIKPPMGADKRRLD